MSSGWMRIVKCSVRVRVGPDFGNQPSLEDNGL